MKYTKATATEAAKEDFQGVWATLHTPLTADNQIDEAGMRSNIDRILTDWKLDGLMFNGAVGEFYALGVAEQKRVIEIAVDATHGRCPNIVMTTATSAADCIELTRFAQEVGADYAAPFNPIFPQNPPERGLAAWWKELARNVDIGLWMIDTGLAGGHLSLELTTELAKEPNIVGLKVQRGTEYYGALQLATKGSIVISDAHEGSSLERIRQGQRVYMSAPAPVLMQRPGHTEMVDYYAAARLGDWDRAQELFDSLAPIRELYESYLSAEKFRGTIAVPVIKAWSAHLGLAAGPVRPPLLEMSDEERDELYRNLDALTA